MAEGGGLLNRKLSMAPNGAECRNGRERNGSVSSGRGFVPSISACSRYLGPKLGPAEVCAPVTAARGAGTSSAVGVGPTFVLNPAHACGSGLATTSRTRRRAMPRCGLTGPGNLRKMTLLRKLGPGEPPIRSARYGEGVAPSYEHP